MDKKQARQLVHQTFTQAFDTGRFAGFSRELVNRLDETKAARWSSQYIKDAFKPYVQRYERLGTYVSPKNETLDVLVVHLTAHSKLERARTAIRNFVADHLKNRDEKDAALVAFVSPSEPTWRCSFIKMEYATVERESGRMGVEARLTPARRYSYIVGEGESCHTAQARFLDLLQDSEAQPNMVDIEEAFSVEIVTKEFFTRYAGLFGEIQAALERLVAKESSIREEFAAKGVSSVDFAKKLLGQIVFLYFLQKKGWLGVSKGEDWGTGPRDFLRRLAKGEWGNYDNFYNDVLEPLFYDELAIDRGQPAWSKRFSCRIPFLNGGLFEPVRDYDWRRTDVRLPNKMFTNTEYVEEGISGTGVLDVFDRYNFTVNEAEPLEKEVAIDPEMLGKVFENLIEENRRKGLGAYYTPREIVHYMCQESLINYLDTALNTHQESLVPPTPRQSPLFGEWEPEQTALQTSVREEIVPRGDLETFVHIGEQISHYEAVDTQYRIRMPKSIEQNAPAIDEALATIIVCDPAVGSGAFPVGMMTEIVRARSTLTPYFQPSSKSAQEQVRKPYDFKRHAIQNSIYGVDIDAGAVEIAKLRLWLSLVVDEEDEKDIKPLPNLDYKIVAGNSLLGVPFKSQRIDEIERLKQRFFDETNHDAKGRIKKQVDKLLVESFAASERSLGYRVNFDFRILFSEVFRDKNGFDVVIGNPPYIKEYTQRSAFDGVRKSPYYQGKMDLWYLFACLGLDVLKQDTGVLAFIATNNWVTNSGASKLRNKIVKDGTILTLLDFGDYKIFESADIQTMVLICARDNARSLYSFDLRRLTPKATGFDDVLRLMAKVPSQSAECLEPVFDRAALMDKPLVFSDTKAEAVLSRIAKMGNFTLDPTSEVAVGIDVHQDFVNKASGVILGSGFQIGDGIFVISDKERRLLSLTKAELELVRPYYTTIELAKYSALSRNSLWVIYTDSSFKDPRRIKPFPNLKRHLDRFRKVITSDNHPYGLHRSRDEKYFKGEKIISLRKCAQPTFTYTDFDCYVSQTFNIIKTERIDLKYLTAILNSKVVTYWLRHKGKMQGKLYQVDKEPLLAIPIHVAPIPQQEVLVGLVDRILAAKRRDPQTDTTAVELEIDRSVYDLYGLTPDDIAEVESEAQGRIG